ncbi:alpha/beta fold hydrolase [Novipirellula artificiosorum]|uniref:Haloalkane dehalogenase n=1 Tax=Novipirellula artificiosorum TaxID=2528016 RepID=A0A5C6DFP8_9BACT|nr:alpha/beta fold hydrolase [Novipirellula artificiosorum]TWU36093.1 Haloalkane dehalogenase [Novipirellula artificiosorum]
MKSIAENLLPYPSHELTIGPHRLRYLDEGVSNDRVLLCVHGNPTWSFYWRSVVDRFQSSYRVVAVDHLGCGRSEKPPRGEDVARGEFPYRMANHRDNLIKLIDALDLEQITLVAHDWGGAIGLSAMLQRRERLDRMVLLNTGAFPPPYVPWRIAACRWPLVGTAAVRGLNAFARAAVSMAMSRQRLSAEAREGLLAPYNTWENRVAIDAFVRDIPTKRSHPTYPTLAKLEADLPSLASIPSLLVWGMKDWCFRVECLRRFEEVWPNATTLEIADAGHYVIEDANAEVLAGMERFLINTDKQGDDAGR